jgi:hypothetical protein
VKVHVFRALSDDSPAAFIARIRCLMTGKKGKLVEAWHPVIFEAPSSNDAEDRATRWWDAEVEKARKAAENAQARSLARQAAKAPANQDIDQ